MFESTLQPKPFKSGMRGNFYTREGNKSSEFSTRGGCGCFVIEYVQTKRNRCLDIKRMKRYGVSAGKWQRGWP